MEQLVNFVIRPPRAEYNPSRDLLQPEFILKGRRYQREDHKITNNHGHTLECSHYMPSPMLEQRPLPCVIYCHGNSGCRADASEAAVILLPSNITVFTLDFSGSGLSEGDYVTLGWNEMNDLKVVITHLRIDKRISCIGLWGRSMGAVTSLMYGAQDPLIAGMVLDSPFSNLVDLMMELVDVYKIRLPKFTLKVAIQYMRKVIQKKARFDILELDAIQFAKKSFIPALFGHATEDSFIPPHHSDLIYKAYVGDKNIIKFEGDHNTPRPQFYYDSINIFFHNVLQPPEDSVAELASRSVYDDMDNLDENVWFDVWKAMQPAQASANTLFPPALDTGGEFKLAEHPQHAVGDSGSQWTMNRSEIPASLGELQDDLSKLLEKDKLIQDASEASSSSVLQMHETDEAMENSLLATCNGMDDEIWAHYFPEAVSDEASSEDRFAQFPSTAEDEERMVMEAIAASLQESRITDSVSEVSETVREGLPPMASQGPSSASLQGGLPANVPSASVQASEDRQRDIQGTSEVQAVSETQTIGMLEALGQRWGIGLFRAMSSRQTDNS